jgi:hypothetical protein
MILSAQTLQAIFATGYLNQLIFSVLIKNHPGLFKTI